MATIENSNGENLVVDHSTGRKNLWVDARTKVQWDDSDASEIFDVEERVFSLYEVDEERPRSRGDLTTEMCENLAEHVRQFVANESSHTDSIENVSVQRITIEERVDVKTIDSPYLPTWEDDFPDDGSMSEQVRWILNNDPTYSDEDISAGVGCSRSLVNDIKRKMD